MSIGVPFHSISAAAFMKRPRSKARGRSRRGSMAGSSRSNVRSSVCPELVEAMNLFYFVGHFVLTTVF